jgi:transcriptional regulator with XRE-family HTH domain
VTGSLGARLRRERERQHITLAAIASATKISAALFEALERDDVSKWPPGIFRRSFIRSYAEAIGLDPDGVAREFAACFPDPAEAIPAGAAADRSPVQTELRLQLAEEACSPAGRRVVDGPLRRCAALLCDAAAIMTITILTLAVVDDVWMPLSLAMAAYVSVGQVLLGHTPGVRVVASLIQARRNTRARSASRYAAALSDDRTEMSRSRALITSSTTHAG